MLSGASSRFTNGSREDAEKVTRTSRPVHVKVEGSIAEELIMIGSDAYAISKLSDRVKRLSIHFDHFQRSVGAPWRAFLNLAFQAEYKRPFPSIVI